MFRFYKIPFFFVVVCIVVAAVASVVSANFPRSLVDDYIVPMIETGSTDYSALLYALLRLIGVFALGVVTAYGYTRIMVSVSQGTMRRVRDELFHMME